DWSSDVCSSDLISFINFTSLINFIWPISFINRTSHIYLVWLIRPIHLRDAAPVYRAVAKGRHPKGPAAAVCAGGGPLRWACPEGRAVAYYPCLPGCGT